LRGVEAVLCWLLLLLEEELLQERNEERKRGTKNEGGERRRKNRRKRTHVGHFYAWNIREEKELFHSKNTPKRLIK